MLISKIKALLVFLVMLLPMFVNAATGELWDVKMTGMGLDMPSTQVCMAKDKITEKDVKAGDDCRTTNFKSLGARHVKFNFSCKDGTTGDADLQGDAKSFKQVMNMVSSGEKMTMNSEGKNTGKACDPDAGKKQMDAAMAKACEDESKKMTGYPMFYPSQGESFCGKYKAAYCSTVKSTASKMDGNAKVFKENAFGHGLGAEYTDATGNWQKAVKACGAGNADSIQKNACNDGIKTANWEAARFICKAEVDAIAARECSGKRNYTSNPIKKEYAGLCGGVSSADSGGRNYSSATSSSGAAGSTTPSGNSGTGAGGAVLEKAKNLKDLFGF